MKFVSSPEIIGNMSRLSEDPPDAAPLRFVFLGPTEVTPDTQGLPAVWIRPALGALAKAVVTFRLGFLGIGPVAFVQVPPRVACIMLPTALVQIRRRTR